MSELELSYEDALSWMRAGLSDYMIDHAVTKSLIRARDPVSALTFGAVARTPVLVGEWLDFAEAMASDPCHSEALLGSWQSHLGAAAALEAFCLDRPLPPLHPELAPWLTAPRLEDSAWWVGLLEPVFHSPLLLGLIQHAFSARVRQTWITQAHPIPWATFQLPARQPTQSIADMVCSDLQGWVEPWSESVETATVLVPAYGRERFDHQLQVEITNQPVQAVVFRDGILFGPNGTLLFRGARPTGISAKHLGQRYGVRFLCSMFYATLGGTDHTISKTELPALYLCDDFHFNYYHTLIDYAGRLARLEYLIQQEHFHIAVSEDDERMLVPILEALGFGDYVLRLPPTAVAFPWIAVAAPPQKQSKAAPDTLQWLANRLHQSFPTSAKYRLLISRQDAGERRLSNEDAVLAVLEPLGFQRVVLSQMQISQQFHLFANAEVVVAPHGAGLSNLVASQPGTAVVEISAAFTPFDCFFWISHVLGHRHVAVIADWQDRDLHVDPTHVLQALSDLGIR